MRRVRWDEVKVLVSGSPYVGGLFESESGLNLTWPLANLYVSTDRLVVEPRFGLARLITPWDFERNDVAYVGARGSLMKESVWIATDAYTCLEFWTWRAPEIVDRLRDLGYPCRPHQGPGSIP